MKTKRGFTLIELIIFIILLGIIANFVFLSYTTIMRGSPKISQQTIYSQAATKCMEWFLGQRYMYGYSYSTLATGTPTPGAAFCNPPQGATISMSISPFTLPGDTISNYKKIDVTISSINTRANLSTIIANY